jgi:5-methylcytosine-specific restriction protein A
MTLKRMQDVTRADVLRAIAECDELGAAAFLQVYGYRASLKYVLRVGDAEYPSKAILGVAAGRTSKQFSGGAAHTVRTLTGLGFEVVRK